MVNVKAALRASGELCEMRKQGRIFNHGGHGGRGQGWNYRLRMKGNPFVLVTVTIGEIPYKK
jgi:hypothetical protein